MAPAALTFTTADWNAAQSFTVSAADDGDAIDGAATFTHSASGGGYASVSIASVAATEDDNDAVGVTVTPTALTVTEESTADYTVVLDSLPTGTVTVTVAKQSGGDDDLTADPTTLTFTTGDWNAAQTVTVSAAADEDADDGTATFTHSATGGGYGSVSIGSVTATEADDDTANGDPAGIVFLDDQLGKLGGEIIVPEGKSARYGIHLVTRPSAPVNIKVSIRSGGDSDVSVKPESFTFTPDDWDIPQSVIVHAQEDDDANPGTAIVKHDATSADSGYNGLSDSIRVTELDNDQAGVTVSVNEVGQGNAALRVPEGGSASYSIQLNTRPRSDVVITISKLPGADEDLEARPTTLTFTPLNWNKPQSVFVEAAEDGDTIEGSAVFQHTAKSDDGDYDGIRIDNLTSTEIENDKDVAAQVVEQWLPGFGRAVARIVSDTINAAPESHSGENRLVIGGREVLFSTKTRKNSANAMIRQGYADRRGVDGPDSLDISARQLLSGSSFDYRPKRGDGERGDFAIWGRAGVRGFSDEENGTAMDGKAASGAIGAEYTVNALTTGLAIFQTFGTGNYRVPTVESGKVEAKITSLHPYLRWQPDETLSAYGIAGFGKGDILVSGPGIRDDAELEMQLVVLGGRTELFERGPIRLDLGLDTSWVRMRANGLEGRGSVISEESSIKGSLEGSYRHDLRKGSFIRPWIEVGIRRDEGESLSGFGAELGAGIHYHDGNRGLTLELDGHRLLLHSDDEVEEWGIQGLVRFSSNKDETGLDLDIGLSRGLLSSSARQLSDQGSDTYEPLGNTNREQISAQLGYGLSAFNGDGILKPFAKAGMREDGSERYGVGMSLTNGPVSLNLERTYRFTGETDSMIGLDATFEW